MSRRSPRDYADLLLHGRWFQSIPDAMRQALLDRATVRELAAGERLFARGDAPTGIFAVLDGAIRIASSIDSGKEALLTLVEAPGWFGEIAVFDGLPRTHDADAEGKTLLLHVSHVALDAILAEQPRFWRELGLLVSGKLRLALIALEDVALHPATVRLARRLLMILDGYGDLAKRKGRVVETSQEQLASMLSISRQTANQLLKDLEAKGFIRVEYGAIEVVDAEGLRRIAGA